MTKIYSGLRSEKGNDSLYLDIEGIQLPRIQKLVEGILTSNAEAKSFLKNPNKYLKENSSFDFDIDISNILYNKLKLLNDDNLTRIVEDKDAKQFIKYMTRLKYLPQNYINKISDEYPEPRVAWAIVVVTPALVYTTLGVVATVGAAVAAVTYIGVKTGGPKFQLSEWKSTMINESVASALSIAYMLGGNEFAQEVDNEIINLVEDEAREYLNQLKISNPILFNKLCQVS
ncbi:hypothetical protein K2V74_05240 [Mammaliicoccus sciuri]|uniref:hypothetical protein n=1 Tax=Mammaliicoccus sciuri TaxID=1296 RepID=UPI001E5F9500|nr:hypothetical protein [Mammaliicoccus sciuri]MCD8873734.1 hypothetical protein [Mammaliicoccus sciuri]